MSPRLNLKGVVNVSLNQEINLPESMTAQDAMREYIKLIEAKPR